MAKKAVKKKAPQEMVIVGSKVKNAIKGNGCKTSSELLEALNGAVHDLIARACERAQGNKRSTVKANDL